ncbi:MAG TPA: hypothetical protein VL128_05995 [Candidatus Eisenbacteria bacterium]|nr:hypothetical protein [Candidatus Eisenbacteria bacterium]
MKTVEVISYAGYKADEALRYLKLGENTIPINSIENRWYSPGETFFRVLVESGDRYLLRHTEAQDSWTLEGFRSSRVDTLKTRGV